MKTYMLSKMERLTARPSKASPEALEAMHRRNKDICCVFVFRAVILQREIKFLADKISEHQIPLLKLTTCQTIQFHDLSADSVPQLVRDALKVGIITHGGGGDNPRNVMASPLTGTAPDETFDVFPYAQAVGEYLLTEMPDFICPEN